MSRLVLSFQDGSDPTWVELTELPVVFVIEDEDFTEDWEPPINCVDEDHLHVVDLFSEVWEGTRATDKREHPDV